MSGALATAGESISYPGSPVYSMEQETVELLPEPLELVREREAEQRLAAVEMLTAAGGQS